MSEYLVVIPLLPLAAQGREIEFAIEGWRRHFKEPHRIVIVGGGLPAFRGEDITCVESPRVLERPNQYHQHLDYVPCFRAVRRAFPDSEGFIFVADDCYAVNDFDIHDVRFLKMLSPNFNFDPNSPNGWRRDKMKTKALLLSEGLPTHNFTTHLPIWFDWDKWEALVSKHRMWEESYVIEDLYFNTYCPDRIPFQLCPQDNLKCGVYTTHPDPAELADAFRRKIWITNSPDGYTKELVTLLDEHFFKKNL